MGLFDRYIDEVPLSSAAEFLHYIRRSNDFWWRDGHCPWIFRGQWNAEWKLQPAAFRPLWQNQLRPLFRQVYKRMKVKGTSDSWDNYWLATRRHLQYYTELEALTQFADLARDIGLSVPRGEASYLKGDISGSMAYRTPSLPREGREVDHHCPEIRLMPIAQHHGVPTRLLDFSTDPILATYFAVGNQFRPTNVLEPERIALHAFDTGHWLLRSFLRNLVLIDGIDGITESDDFIRSQSGRFVLIKLAADYYAETASWPSIEDVLSAEGLRLESKPDDLRRLKLVEDANDFSSLIRKITLPVREVPTLLQTLEREGTSLAHLMPTLDNVARTIRDRWSRYS